MRKMKCAVPKERRCKLWRRNYTDIATHPIHVHCVEQHVHVHVHAQWGIPEAFWMKQRITEIFIHVYTCVVTREGIPNMPCTVCVSVSVCVSVRVGAPHLLNKLPAAENGQAWQQVKEVRIYTSAHTYMYMPTFQWRYMTVHTCIHTL